MRSNRLTMSATAAVAATGLATALAAGPANARETTTAVAATARVVSPLLLVTVNGNLFTIKSDGSGLKQLTSGGSIGDAAYSPDGTRIAYHRKTAGQNDLYVMRSDGTGVQRLTNTSTYDEKYPSWSPDGTRLVFDRKQITNPQNGGIAIMKAVPGASFTTIKRNPATTDYYSEYYERADWSPKGDKIAISHVYNGDHVAVGGELITTTGAHIRSLPGDQNEFDPTGAWVTDYSPDYWDPSYGYKVNVATGAAIAVPVGVDDQNASEMTWSPDGKSIAMRYDCTGDSWPDLCVMTSAGTGVRALKTGSATYKIIPRSWSPR